MKIQCAWCQKWMGEKPPMESADVSHGICPECSAKIEKGKPVKKNPLKEADFMTMKGWALTKGTRSKPEVFLRTAGNTLTQVIQREARAWRLLMRSFIGSELLSVGEYPLLSDASIVADKRMRELVKDNPRRKSGGVLVRDEQLSGRVAMQVYQTSARRFTVVLLDKSKYSMMGRQVYGVYHSLERANQAVDFWIQSVWLPQKAERERYGIKDNPLAVFTAGANPGKKTAKTKRKQVQDNPPKSVSADVCGIVYNRCLEIRAEKTGWSRGLYKHPFSRKAHVQILALDNGDLLIHSASGIRLWREA